MHEYVFIHIDATGSMWKHIHFSRIAAERARRWWASLKTTTECSYKITERKRTTESPQLIGVNVAVAIPLKER